MSFDMRRVIPEKIKQNVKTLRTQGLSIGQIANKVGIAKSTVYEWTKTIDGAAKYAELGRVRWLKELQPLGAMGQRRKREKRIAQLELTTKNAISEFEITQDVQKAILSALYWAEGTKVRGILTFANTDPKLALLFITLLRNCYTLDESKLRIRLHLHEYHDEDNIKRFWSNLLKIPIRQFTKTYLKHRSKEKTFRRNIGGICFISYNSVYLKEEIVQFGQILGEKITNNLRS